jgi:hypothetical protein
MISLLVLALLLGGCGGSGGSGVDKEKQHILNVVELAKQYETAAKKKPTSIDDVKTWAVKEGKATEADFVSPRDQHPYVLMSGMMGLLVYEQTGKNGKVYMYNTSSGVREVDPGEISTMKRMESMRRGPARGMKK